MTIIANLKHEYKEFLKNKITHIKMSKWICLMKKKVEKHLGKIIFSIFIF